ncbi:MAG TPA: hypothetical protein VJU14_06085 [Solirubrobacterales bacterium]|nr:hypothetical protein [Solirubrobacterales bacterium]
MAARSRSMRVALGLIASIALTALLFSVGVAGAAEVQKLSRFGPDGTDASNFESADSIALDQAEGFVYVLDQDGLEGTLLKFDLDGDPVSFTGGSPDIEGNEIKGLAPFVEDESYRIGTKVAVDSASHRIYMTEQSSLRAFEASGEPAEFAAGPGAGTSEIPGFTDLNGVAVDGAGNIYASDHLGTISVFAPTGAPLTTFSVAQPQAIAVSATGVVFVIPTTEDQPREIRRYTPNAMPVTEGATYTETAFAKSKFQSGGLFAGVAVDGSNGDVYALETAFTSTWVRRFNETGALVEEIGAPDTPSEGSSLGGGSTGIAVLDESVSIEPDETVKFYTGDTEGTESKIALFGIKEIIDKPYVTGLRVTKLTSESARLHAFVDPNLKSTSYRFEYGPEDCSVTTCISVPVGGANIGEGEDPVAVSHLVTGLEPNSLYHYRIVAENELGSGEEAGTFSTMSIPGPGFQLSDGRVWEMVSPPNKGSAVLNVAGYLVQAAANGDGIVYSSRGSVEDHPEGNRSLEPSFVHARRGTGGWSSKDLSPPSSRMVPSAELVGEFRLFRSDLARALLEPADGSQLSPEATERTPYLWEDGEPPLYVPLVTAANVPPGTEFGGNPFGSQGAVVHMGANDDFTAMVLKSAVPLSEEVPAPVEGAPAPVLYYWQAGELKPLSVLPADEGGDVVSTQLLGSGIQMLQHAISHDGSRIFWSGGGLVPDSLYMRDTAAEESVRLDVAQPPALGTGPAEPVFQGANPDGTVVIFKESRQLTQDASPTGSDFYRCEILTVDPSGGCATLTNLTGATETDSESAEVLGLVSGMSDDGETVYFVARGILDAAANTFGDAAEAGKPNLYVSRGGEVRFIATLAEADRPNWGGVDALADDRSSAASPSGRYLAFMSQKSLARHPNLDSETGDPVQQVFVYDSQTDRIDCASCHPLGAAPTGEVPTVTGFLGNLDPQRQWLGRRISAVLPQPVGTLVPSVTPAPYRPRVVLDNGRVFFNSRTSLVVGDSNSQWDVYQFEPIGTGSCTALSAGRAVIRSGGGCISLLSSGTGVKEALFFDASASGDDVFFLTPAQLSVRDKDQELDVYDARVGGTEDALKPAWECSGEACRPATPAPPAAAPPSSSFSGAGNVKAKKCPKGKRKVRRGGKTRCVRKKSAKSKQRPGRADQAKGGRR